MGASYDLPAHRRLGASSRKSLWARRHSRRREIVSARGRDIGAGPYDDFIQIDAPVVLHHIADICGRVHCMTVNFQNDVQELLSSH